MTIANNGPYVTIGSKSINKANILLVDFDSENVMIVMSDRKEGRSTDANTITIPYSSVTSPSSFGSSALLAAYIGSIIKHSGVCNDSVEITLSDTVDCANGYLKVKNNATGGTIKYTTVDGTTDSDTFEAGKVSEFRVKRVWSTGTAVSVTGIRIIV